MVCIDDEIPFKLPVTWTWLRLKHASEIARGGSPRPIKEYLTDLADGINWIKIGDTEKDGMYINSTKEKIKPEGLSKSRLVHKGDFLLTNSMSFGRPYITNIDGCIHDGWLVISPIGTSYIQKFLYYLLSSGYAYSQFAEKVSGAVVKNLNSDKVADALFPLPPYNEQQRILDKLDELIPKINTYGLIADAISAMNLSLKPRLRKSILQEAIQGKLVPQDSNDEPASVLLEKIRAEKAQLVKEGKLRKKDIVDSVIYKGDANKYFEKKGVETICIDDEIPFEIPESWEWCRISTICNITNGFTPLRTEEKFWRNGNINWFTIEDIRTQGEYINYTTQKITKEATAPERIVRPGSVLLCCTASVGQCAFTNIPTTTNQQFNALTIKDYYRHLMIDEYLFLFAKTLKDELHRLSGKTTFEFISVKKVGNILVPIPPLNEQKRIVAIVNKSLASIMRG